MEQLFTNRKFHFCYHRNFRVFFLNGKRPLFLTLYLSKILLLLSFSTRKHTYKASRAILSNFIEELWTQYYPRYLFALSRVLFPTTFLEIAVYLTIIPRVRVGYEMIIANSRLVVVVIKNAHKILRILPDFICKNNRLLACFLFCSDVYSYHIRRAWCNSSYTMIVV